jgi:hypothetical protein
MSQVRRRRGLQVVGGDGLSVYLPHSAFTRTPSGH